MDYMPSTYDIMTGRIEEYTAKVFSRQVRRGQGEGLGYGVCTRQVQVVLDASLLPLSHPKPSVHPGPPPLPQVSTLCSTPVWPVCGTAM